MRYYRRAAYLILALVLVLFSSINYAFPAKPRTVSEATVVKVSVAEGHGSGVNIGNGYIVTAAHVPGEAATVKIKTSGGKEFDADVLWVNHVYDVALLRADPKALGGGQPA
jgi:S1-C subfamily serine protease